MPNQRQSELHGAAYMKTGGMDHTGGYIPLLDGYHENEPLLTLGPDCSQLCMQIRCASLACSSSTRFR